MKKNNKKGFTLIELLAVIVLLVLISSIAIPSLTASLERSKAKQREAKIKVIEEAGRLYYYNNSRLIKRNPCAIPISELELSDKDKENPQGGTFNGYVIRNGNDFIYVDTKDDNVNNCKD